MADERAKLKKPCDGCPYARATSPEYVRARGRDVRRFIGQAVAPFLLPCHHTADREGWPNDSARPQCAGAAMYRDLTGVAGRMPDALTRLKGDPSLVFATPAEYLAHHDGIPVADAEALLRKTPPRGVRDGGAARRPHSACRVGVLAVGSPLCPPGAPP